VCDTDNLFTKVESTSKKLVEISTKNCCCCCTSLQSVPLQQSFNHYTHVSAM